MYEKIVAACLRCDPISACDHDEDCLEPPWEVIDRILKERNEMLEINESLEIRQAAMKSELKELRHAVQMLRGAKGRYHTHIAYEKLIKLV